MIWSSFSVQAQSSPVFEAAVDASSINVGHPFEVSFRLRNAEGQRFRPPNWGTALRVINGPSFEQSMGFINGRSYTQQGWRFLIEAKKEGTVTIEPAAVTVDGKVLRSQPLTLTIGQASSGIASITIPSGSGEVFIISKLSHKTAFEGQQVTWQILLYTLVDIDGVDVIEMPNFKGFYAQDKKRFDTRLQHQVLKGKKYAVKTLYESAIYPQESGEVTIGTAKIRVGIEQKGGLGGFFGGIPKILETQPVKLTVKPLPIPIPENFSGGIGRYTWEVQADKDMLTTDDALTLKVSLRGNGDVRRFSYPKLGIPNGLEAFEPKVVTEETYENGEEFVHEQTLEYAILPKIPGDYTFQPEFCWFNPDSNRYLRFSPTQPIQLHVTAGVNYRPPGSEADPHEVPPTDRTANFLERVRQYSSNWLFFKWFASLVGIVLALFLINWAWRKKNTPPPDTTATMVETVNLPRYSVQELFSQAKSILASGDNTSTGYAVILKALHVFLSEKFDIAPALMNREDVSARLLARQIPPIRVQALILLWDQCESAVYGGDQPNIASLENTLKDATQIIKDLRE